MPNSVLQSGCYRPTDSNPFVSERLQTYQSAPINQPSKRSSLSNDVDRYCGMSESSVSERALAFKSAAKKVVASNRQSLIPNLRVEEKGKRILREEWIKNNSPISSPDKAKNHPPRPKTKRIASTSFIDQRQKSISPRAKRSSMSSARTEMPKMLAHVKVSERASNYTAHEEESSQRGSSRYLTRSESPSLVLSEARTEMPTMLAHVKVSERASNYHIPIGDDDHHTNSSILGGTSLSHSTARTEMPTMLAHVKVSSLSSNFHSVEIVAGEEHSKEYPKANRSSSVRTEMRQLKAHVKVSERASHYAATPRGGNESTNRESKIGSRRSSIGTFVISHLLLNHFILFDYCNILPSVPFILKNSDSLRYQFLSSILF